MSILAFKSALELATLVRTKRISSTELTRYFISRIERFSTVNAVVTRSFDRALEAAKRADAVLARGDSLGLLHGLPITVKEDHNVAGLRTTWGVPSYADNIAAKDCEVVRRFTRAGAHILGKTNVPYMLGDFQAYNDLFGTTDNPWDLTRTPGGSSGGAAAALAAGLTALEHGSDLGGSIRNPAHYCGVYGHKPTWDLIPMRGHGVPNLPPPPILAVVGPLARSADDLDLALDVLAGGAILPSTHLASLRGLRVAVWPNDPIAPVDIETSDRVQSVADLLAKRGAFVSDLARPAFDVAEYRRAYVTLVQWLGGDRSPTASYLEASERAEGFREAWRFFFDEWDVLLCPVMATTAFPHNQSPMATRTIPVDGDEQRYFAQVFWTCLATVGHLPATVFPTGLSRSGLPLGLQAIGPELGDRTTIRFARLMAEDLCGFTPPPGFSD